MIYLASPYTHPDESVMEGRFKQVVAVAAAMINQGAIVYSPIMHFHPIAQMHGLPRDFTYWKLVNEAVLQHCNKILILHLHGWEESQGITAEIAFAREHGVAVYHIDPSQWLT
jgi:hypothetical protein